MGIGESGCPGPAIGIVANSTMTTGEMSGKPNRFRAFACQHWTSGICKQTHAYRGSWLGARRRLFLPDWRMNTGVENRFPGQALRPPFKVLDMTAPAESPNVD